MHAGRTFFFGRTFGLLRNRQKQSAYIPQHDELAQACAACPTRLAGAARCRGAVRALRGLAAPIGRVPSPPGADSALASFDCHFNGAGLHLLTEMCRTAAPCLQGQSGERSGLSDRPRWPAIFVAAANRVTARCEHPKDECCRAKSRARDAGLALRGSHRCASAGASACVFRIVFKARLLRVVLSPWGVPLVCHAQVSSLWSRHAAAHRIHQLDRCRPATTSR